MLPGLKSSDDDDQFWFVVNQVKQKTTGMVH